MRRLDPQTFAFTLLLGALGSMPPLAIDMALPALPPISVSLSASIGDVTLMLSVFMAGFALAQLLFGPLSDRFGRRPILLVGCVLFTLASCVCALAPNLATLLSARFFQGCGAGAGMVMIFAMIRELFEGAKARARLSYVSMVINLAPMIAPTLGAAILGFAHWRFIFGALAVGGAALTTVIALGLGESLATPDPHALRARRLLSNYARVLATPAAIGNILVNALSFGCLFAYVAGSSFLMMRVLGLSPSVYGLTFACTALGIMTGSFINSQLSRRHVSAHTPLILGLMGEVVGACILTALTLAGAVHLAVFLPLLVLCTLSFGLVAPNAAHGAMQPLPEIAGVAGASLGFTQMTGGALASAMVALLSDGVSPLSMTATMTLCSCAALAVYWLWVRPAERRGEVVRGLGGLGANRTV